MQIYYIFLPTATVFFKKIFNLVRFFLEDFMGSFIGDFQSFFSEGCITSDYKGEVSLKHLCDLFVRVFAANAEISVIANLLETEITAVFKKPYAQRSGFFLESSGRSFEALIVSRALLCIENPKKNVEILSFNSGCKGLGIPIFCFSKCIGYIILYGFNFDNGQEKYFAPSFPVLERHILEYAVTQIFKTSSKILDYCIRCIVEEGYEPKADYKSIFKYGNYYDFNLITDTYILSRSTGAILGLRNETFSTLDEFYSIVIPEDRDRVSMFLKDSVMKAEPFMLETQIVRPVDNKKVWVEIKGIVLKDDNGFAVRVHGTVLDITRLKETQTRLETEIENKNRLMKIIGHDLKNPFNSLIGFSGLLLEALSLGDYSEAKEYAQIIKTSASEGYDLLVNLLDYSNMYSEDVSINLRKINFNDLVDSVVDLISPQAFRKNIVLRNNVSRECIVLGDESKLSTVVRNLVSNAVKFSFPSKPVEISAEEISSEKIRVTISNCGSEISKEKLDKINSGEKIGSSLGTDSEKGTGFGLILCHKFLSLHDSSLSASYQDGVTVFSFIIEGKIC